MSLAATARHRAYYWLFGADRLLAGELRSGDVVVDAGCSDGRGSAVLRRHRPVIGVDIYRPMLRRARDGGLRSEAINADLRQLPIADAAVDVVVALDVIEHFDKPEALDVVGELERIAKRTVVLLTPSGFLAQPGTADEPWQEHRCGFSAAELEAIGYDVVGAGGLGSLRGDYAAVRGGPLGQAFALLTVPLAQRRPDRAFYLFAVKHRG